MILHVANDVIKPLRFFSNLELHKAISSTKNYNYSLQISLPTP